MPNALSCCTLTDSYAWSTQSFTPKALRKIQRCTSISCASNILCGVGVSAIHVDQVGTDKGTPKCASASVQHLCTAASSSKNPASAAAPSNKRQAVPCTLQLSDRSVNAFVISLSLNDNTADKRLKCGRGRSEYKSRTHTHPDESVISDGAASIAAANARSGSRSLCGPNCSKHFLTS